MDSRVGDVAVHLKGSLAPVVSHAEARQRRRTFGTSPKKAPAQLRMAGKCSRR